MEDDMGEVRAMYGTEQKILQGFGWKSERNRPLGQARRTWNNNVKMDLKYIDWKSMDLIQLAQDYKVELSFDFQKVWWVSWLAEEISAFWRLRSMEVVS